jgi:hypothetical protein
MHCGINRVLNRSCKSFYHIHLQLLSRYLILMVEHARMIRQLLASALLPQPARSCLTWQRSENISEISTDEREPHSHWSACTDSSPSSPFIPLASSPLRCDALLRAHTLNLSLAWQRSDDSFFRCSSSRLYLSHIRLHTSQLKQQTTWPALARPRRPLWQVRKRNSLAWHSGEKTYRSSAWLIIVLCCSFVCLSPFSWLLLERRVDLSA